MKRRKKAPQKQTLGVSLFIETIKQLEKQARREFRTRGNLASQLIAQGLEQRKRERKLARTPKHPRKATPQPENVELGV